MPTQNACSFVETEAVRATDMSKVRCQSPVMSCGDERSARFAGKDGMATPGPDTSGPCLAGPCPGSDPGHGRIGHGLALGVLAAGQRALVLVLDRRHVRLRDDLAELANGLVPAGEQSLSPLRPRIAYVALHDGAELCAGRDRSRDDEVVVEPEVEDALRIVEEDLAAAHPGADVPAEASEDDDGAARHVLAGVLADALDDGGRARVPYGESLACLSCAEELAAGGAVEHRVPEQDRGAGVVLRRAHDDPAAAHALADVVVRLADELELDASREEGAEALAGRALEPRAHASRRRAGAEAARHEPADPGADGAVVRADRIPRLDDARPLAPAAPHRRAARPA